MSEKVKIVGLEAKKRYIMRKDKEIKTKTV